jgi:very-short-patch-repair endonuclease
MPHNFSTNYTTRTKALARVLRKNENEPETKLWNAVRGKQLGVRFRRQVPIGKYIVDLASLELKLIIEVDGIQHQSDTGRRADAIRDTFLREKGFCVMGFSNDDVTTNVDGVADQILAAIEELKKQRPHPRLPKQALCGGQATLPLFTK